MSFEQTTRGAIGEDIVNKGGVMRIVPSALVEQDRTRWYERMTDKDRPPSETNRLESFFFDQADKNILQAYACKLAQFSGSAEVMADASESARFLSAAHALSCLAGIIIGKDHDFTKAGDGPYEATSQSKLLIDFDAPRLPRAGNTGRSPRTKRALGELGAMFGASGARSAPDAHAIIVHRDRLQVDPFPGADSTPHAETWYQDTETGIYVASRIPAVPSRTMIHNLTRATGSLQNALAIIDASNSVSLMPYMSARYIDSQR